jgi:hypothetical protein
MFRSALEKAIAGSTDYDQVLKAVGRDNVMMKV